MILFHMVVSSGKTDSQFYGTMDLVTEVWETRVWSLGQKDPLEDAMATHSSILAWRIPWTEEPGGLTKVHRVAESDTTEVT